MPGSSEFCIIAEFFNCFILQALGVSGMNSDIIFTLETETAKRGHQERTCNCQCGSEPTDSGL